MLKAMLPFLKTSVSFLNNEKKEEIQRFYCISFFVWKKSDVDIFKKTWYNLFRNIGEWEWIEDEIF